MDSTTASSIRRRTTGFCRLALSWFTRSSHVAKPSRSGSGKSRLLVFLSLLTAAAFPAVAAQLNANYTSASVIPVTQSSYIIPAGDTVNFTLQTEGNTLNRPEMVGSGGFSGGCAEESGLEWWVGGEIP